MYKKILSLILFYYCSKNLCKETWKSVQKYKKKRIDVTVGKMTVGELASMNIENVSKFNIYSCLIS